MEAAADDMKIDGRPLTVESLPASDVRSFGFAMPHQALKSEIAFVVVIVAVAVVVGSRTKHHL